VGAPELVSYTFVLLRRGPRADAFSEAELAELQAGHVGYMAELRERGAVLANGPFRDQPDETLRGVCLFTGSLEEARELVSRDPSVAAGRMAADVFTWLVPPGLLAPSGEPAGP
jgi:uncharacterized protein YciI